MARTNSYRTFVTEFPNLFLATTYALNKSNSKRVCIGLEHYNGYFHEVVKIINNDKYNTTVTLDHHDWNCFRDQFDPINSYFKDSYAFYHDHGKPNKIFLTHHDLAFTTSYGTKSILLEERPSKKEEEKPATNDNNHSMDTDEPHCKKMKVVKPTPSIVMQYPTFEGLRKQSLLIDLALDELKSHVGKVNRTLDLINEYLKNIMSREGEEQNNRMILSDLKGFQGFYGVLNADIEGYVTEKLPDDDSFINDKLKFVLAEILAYGLPIIMNDMRNSFGIVI